MKAKLLWPLKALWWLISQPRFWWGCLVVAVCLLIWLAGPGIAVFGFNPLQAVWVRLLCIAVVLAACAYRLLGVRLKQWLQGRKFRDEASTEELERKPLPKSTRRRLKRQFAELLQFLKSASNDKLKKQSLYELPWYLVIGPSLAGKESMLKASGLDFSYMSRHQQQEKSDTFDWWVTEEAVYIKVASHLFDHSAPRAPQHWKFLLKLLRRARPRRALNGVLLVLGLQELLSEGAALNDDDSHLVQNTRLRLQELQSKLGLALPVYVVVNKLDCLAGFKAYFAELSEQQRRQVFGMTFPDIGKRDQEHPADLFSYYFDDLVGTLHRRVLGHMNQDLSSTQNLHIYQFPLQFSALKNKLSSVVRGVFSHRRFFKSLRLRGIYFVSAEQGLQLDDLLLNEHTVSKNLVVKPRGRHSYFIGQLLQELMVPEAELVGVNRRYEQRWNLWRHTRLALILGGSVAIVLGWVASFVETVHYQDTVSIMARQYTELPPVDPNQNTLARIYPQLDLLGTMAHLHDTMPGAWLMHLGLYQSNPPYRVVTRWYQQVLIQQFLPYVLTSLEAGLRYTLAQPSGQSETAQLATVEQVYGWLSSYLMLNQPEHRNAAQIQPLLQAWWGQQFYGNEPQQAWLSVRLQDLLQADIPVQAVNASAVAKARQVLWHSPVYLQAYVHLKTALSAGPNPGYSVISADNVAEAQVFDMPTTGVSVASLFTRQGYRDGYRKHSADFLEQASQAQWVLGNQYHVSYSSANLTELKQQMNALYWRDYLTAWDQALANVNIAAFGSLSQAIANLTLLTQQHDSPIVQVLERVRRNTTWQSNGSGLLGFAGSHSAKLNGEVNALELGSSGNIVDDHFAPLNALLAAPSKGQPPIDDVLKSLVQLQQCLNAIANSSNPPLAAYQESQAIFAGKPNPAIALVNQEIARVPMPLAKWLQQILANSYQVIFAEANQYLAQRWQEQVLTVYQDQLQGRFPMVATSDKTANVEDFLHFFAPNGVEASFVTSYLTPFVTVDAQDHVTWARIANVPFATDNTIPQSMTEARQIQQAFFSNGSDHQIQFTLRPLSLGHDTHKVVLSYNGKTFSYPGKPALFDLTWPALEDGSVVLSFSQSWLGHAHSQHYLGPWGLFRLFSKSSRSCSSESGACTVTFQHGSQQATFMLNAATVNDPFDLTLLQQYQVPAWPTSGGDGL